MSVIVYAELLTRGLSLIATALDGARYDQFEYEDPTAIVFGSEARGVERAILDGRRVRSSARSY